MISLENRGEYRRVSLENRGAYRRQVYRAGVYTGGQVCRTGASQEVE